MQCSIADEFQCVSDKKCIAAILRCDNVVQCHDGSDEANCDGEEQDEGWRSVLIDIL